MLIGDIAKGTKINIYYDTPDGLYTYTTVVIERGNTNFELVVKAILTEDNKIARFNANHDIKIELTGSSKISLKVDSIDFNYNNGTITHIIRCRTRIEINNKRETFRLPLKIACTFSTMYTANMRAMVRDISYGGISIIANNTDINKIGPKDVISIEFTWGLNAVSFDLRCKIVRIQQIGDSDKSVIGCTLQTGQNNVRTLITHLQMEELKRKRNNYTLTK